MEIDEKKIKKAVKKVSRKVNKVIDDIRKQYLAALQMFL